jgi:hypothetical protein
VIRHYRRLSRHFRAEVIRPLKVREFPFRRCTGVSRVVLDTQALAWRASGRLRQVPYTAVRAPLYPTEQSACPASHDSSKPHLPDVPCLLPAQTGVIHFDALGLSPHVTAPVALAEVDVPS